MLRGAGKTLRPPVRIVDSVDQVPPVDTAFVAVRADQLADAGDAIAHIRAGTVVSLVNLADQIELWNHSAGRERAVLGFPGVGGSFDATGVVDYFEIRQQPTLIGWAADRERPVRDDLRAAGFKTTVTRTPEDWLLTHAVFIVALGAATLAADSAETVGSSETRTRDLVLAIRDGFRVLARQGHTVAPPPLRLLFTRLPTPLAVRYWRAQLAGDLGRISLTPHFAATRTSELPFLARRVRAYLGSVARLDQLLDAARLGC